MSLDHKKIFMNFYENLFILKAHNHCKSVNFPLHSKMMLIVDNCTVHPDADSLKKEKTGGCVPSSKLYIYFAALRLYCIMAFKWYYKNNFLLLDSIKAQKDILDIMKKFTVKEALRFAARAWNKLKLELWQSCCI